MSNNDLLNGYDIVVALTQKFLNSQLSAITEPAPKPNSPPPPKGANTNFPIENSFTLMADPTAPEGSPQAYQSIIVTSMNAPTITIQNNASVLFTLHISQGTVQYIDTAKLTKATASLDNVDISFNVNMALATIADPTKLDATSSSIQQLQGFQDSDFTIQFLALEFESSNLISSFNVSSPDFANNSPQYEVLLLCLNTYFTGSAGSPTNISANPYILGYPISSTNPTETNPVLPDFAATSCEFSTTVNPNSAALSTLNYCLMTNNNPFPTAANRGIFNTPWVTDAEYSGMMTVDNEVFSSGYVEAYILPIIKQSLKINTNWTTNSSGWSINSETSGTKEIDITGPNPSADYTLKTNCNVSLSNAGLSSDDGIVITANGSFDFYVKVTQVLMKLAEVEYIQPWTLTITLNTGQNGQFKMTVNTVLQTLQNPLNDEGWFAEFGDWSLELMADMLNLLGINASWDSMTEMTTGVVTDQLNKMTADFQTNVVNELNVLGNQFVLPAGGVFSYNGIFLNSENDMQVNIVGSQ